MKKMIVLNWLIAAFSMVGVESNACDSRDKEPTQDSYSHSDEGTMTYSLGKRYSRSKLTSADLVTPENIAKARVFCDTELVADAIRKPIPEQMTEHQKYHVPASQKEHTQYVVNAGVRFLSIFQWYAALFNFLNHEEIASNIMGESPSTVRTKTLFFMTPGRTVALSGDANEFAVRECYSHLVKQLEKAEAKEEAKAKEEEKMPQFHVRAVINEGGKKRYIGFNPSYSSNRSDSSYDEDYSDYLEVADSHVWPDIIITDQCRDLYSPPSDTERHLWSVNRQKYFFQALYVLLYHWQYNIASFDEQQKIERILAAMLKHVPHILSNRFPICRATDKTIEKVYPALKTAYEKELEAVRSINDLAQAATPPEPLIATSSMAGVESNAGVSPNKKPKLHSNFSSDKSLAEYILGKGYLQLHSNSHTGTPPTKSTPGAEHLRPKLTSSALVTPENVAKARVFCNMEFIADTIQKPIPELTPVYQYRYKNHILGAGVRFLANLQWYAALFNLLDHKIASNIMGESPSIVQKNNVATLKTPSGTRLLDCNSSKEAVRDFCSHIIAQQKEEKAKEKDNTKEKEQYRDYVTGEDIDLTVIDNYLFGKVEIFGQSWFAGRKFIFPMPNYIQTLYILLYHWHKNIHYPDVRQKIEQVLASMLERIQDELSHSQPICRARDKMIEKLYPALKTAYERELEAVRSINDLYQATTPPEPLNAIMMPCLIYDSDKQQ